MIYYDGNYIICNGGCLCRKHTGSFEVFCRQRSCNEEKRIKGYFFKKCFLKTEKRSLECQRNAANIYLGKHIILFQEEQTKE